MNLEDLREAMQNGSDPIPALRQLGEGHEELWAAFGGLLGDKGVLNPLPEQSAKRTLPTPAEWRRQSLGQRSAILQIPYGVSPKEIVDLTMSRIMVDPDILVYTQEGVGAAYKYKLTVRASGEAWEDISLLDINMLHVAATSEEVFALLEREGISNETTPLSSPELDYVVLGYRRPDGSLMTVLLVDDDHGTAVFAALDYVKDRLAVRSYTWVGEAGTPAHDAFLIWNKKA